ncbi:DUF4136 domain-containing protein [Fulvivirga sedimenti]|uniref:DUF4136 domain-containing protein n=1 Tax=Fulvivirga sedimenti TaxID=2879465 RepID=A0A9X1HSU4_9BACT|nr:DUF4136 domain-containing protein [Fulvivirga sedimenti]MCA6075423.1 DUF4136 domain-containing protein [Fulvivirga sedimenti]MCA6076600.1 DUF4136 domain-containing protein [Fulvivirga sedimenti]MCA6077728.1 DUF4136 domain-containing protein [Fulvivirga sedimenti]
MKKLYSIALLILLTGCFSYKELPVEYDYSYRGRFDKYNSYDFIRQEENFTDSKTEISGMIRGSIESHMNFLGYKLRDRKPDLLLSYTVYMDSLNFRGYSQPDIEEWMRKKDRDLSYDQLKLNIPRGTLLIQVFDRKQNVSIWQGYATDNYGDVNFADQREVRNAVRSILNKYQFFADGFLEEKKELMTQTP